jgi:dynein heavy chain
MQAESDRWRGWFDQEKPEQSACPGKYKSLTDFERLMILRALRPDRVTAALDTFVSDNLGAEYVENKSFNLPDTYPETAPDTPMFFVLFPGVDPTVWVEALAKKFDFTSSNGRFVNISMGQGQEENAMNTLDRLTADGGWIFFQNVHLMQDWLPLLERRLELAAADSHEDFRCFISAEPPPLTYMKNMPESLMQSCVKVANEAPADLRSNFIRAWANFDEDLFAESAQPGEFKGCLFALCFYHAVVLGRRRFGFQGWSKRYSFNTGDLTVCADVLMSYINAAGHAPWEDLRYVIGQIMYGGHITDMWDRRTNNTYLSVYLVPSLLEQMELAPGFSAPNCNEMNYSQLDEYIKTQLPRESPPMFGLHPNAEIGYLTTLSDSLFYTILSLSGVSGGSGGAADAQAARPTMENLIERCPENFDMIDVGKIAAPLLEEDTAPYVLVALQELNRMNTLLSEIRRSLVELKKGLSGQLNMSEPMEHLAEALTINQVPGRNIFHKASWEKYAWPSRKSLQSWFSDLLRRVEQLGVWSESLETPVSIWLPGLFNPMAYLTAIMQVTARHTNLPLDKMAVDTHVTTFLEPSEVSEYPEDGMFVHGLFIEGARWPGEDDEPGEVEIVGVTPCRGHLADSKLKELLPPLPVMYMRAVPVQPTWSPESVGYMRNMEGIYECPLYTTTARGPTYVFLCTLKTLEPKSKWVRAGVAMIMQEDG